MDEHFLGLNIVTTEMTKGIPIVIWLMRQTVYIHMKEYYDIIILFFKRIGETKETAVMMYNWQI